MNTFHDYESFGWMRPFGQRQPVLLEGYRGSDIVDWHGRIEQSLVNLLNDAEKASNYTYANRVRAFLETWRENPIDGSLNRETIAILSAAAKQWSREDWDLQAYYLSLHTKLRQLIASEEELPRDVDTSQNDAFGGGGGGGGGGAPPMSPSFGPSEGEPEGLGGGGGGGGGGDMGMGGGMGPEGGMPGAEGELPPGEEGLEGAEEGEEGLPAPPEGEEGAPPGEEEEEEEAPLTI